MKFAVIGLGSFGGHCAKTLYKNGHEVLAVDSNKDRIEEMKTYVSHAVNMEAAGKENLEALGLQEMDVVVVSLGPNMEASILTVLFLHEMRVKRIVAKALSEDHLKILEAVGATEVIYPERDMAIKTALKLSNPNVLEYLPLPSGFGIQEIAPPEKFIPKSSLGKASASWICATSSESSLSQSENWCQKRSTWLLRPILSSRTAISW
jgi:trk system potassium uptake protein TrkA